MTRARHVLINGLSVGSGGGYTVARELWRHLGAARTDWKFSLCLASGNSLHEQMRTEAVPSNCQLQWTDVPLRSHLDRSRYEAGQLPGLCRDNGVDVVVQLNGMIVPQLSLPTLSHFQDPWPYRPEAWGGMKDRAVAFLKRRAHRRALRGAAAVSWTSAYLRDLICGRLGVSPRRSHVLYNGVPDSWIARAAESSGSLDKRPLRLVSVSNVTEYKRQELVVRALPMLLKNPELRDITYHIAGECANYYREHLTAVARQLGVERQVVIEGRVSDDRVRELMANSRCFVLMSVCESFGIPAVEAMTFGTPVVTSDCCAMPEICGNAAVLSPVDDPIALAKNIEVVLTDRECSSRLRQAGEERVRMFRWEATAGQMAQIIEDISQ